MTKNNPIYIITENIGQGHRSVSEALKESIEDESGTKVVVIDYFSLIGQGIEKSMGNIYGYLILNFPYLYKLIYSLIDREDSSTLMDMLIAQRLKNKIGPNIKNAILIATFPNSTIALSFIKAHRRYAVITDYYAHQGWITKKIDGYFVANKEIKLQLKKAGINENTIHITGIPIKKEFYKKVNKLNIKKRLGINNSKKVVLILGGGDGVIPDAEYIVSLFDNKNNVIIITAKNNSLKKSLEKRNLKNTKILGYVDNMYELISIADLAITKAGGISLSELNLKRIPIIVYKTIPGQETANTIYFTKKHACKEINDKKELKITANKILSGKMKLNGIIVDKKIPAFNKIINIINKDL
jgi:processive 1,2-diacylglycerol beta-glucosyltransferase